MTAQTLMAIFAGIALLVSLLGWAYQLGFLGARVNRSEQDIAELKRIQTQSERDFRAEMRESFGKVYSKLDELPCKNSGFTKEKC